ncbi:MAG: recombinase family protein, partial [Niameybacter sp.]
MNSTSVEQLPIEVTSVSSDNSQQQLSKPRVAAYCRVSTAEELQLGSLENQIINYTNRIRANTDWYFAGIYSDKGKSGTSLENRIGFNRMIRNALNGEIDIIICKSISRFSRNIVDTLDTVKQLDDKGVHIIFERERLNTKDSSSSLILKVLATFAEEESRNTSENIEWALNKRFERGEVVAGSNNLYGYDIRKNKGWE